MTKRITIWDLDGVIANNTHRLHWIKRDKPDWKTFQRLAVHDTPYQSAIIIYTSMLLNNIAPVVVTARHESERLLTADWFINNNIPLPHIHLMRPNDCNDSSVVYKRECLAVLRTFDYVIVAAFEDNPDCVAMYREQGVTCFAADPHNWDGPELHR